MGYKARAIRALRWLNEEYSVGGYAPRWFFLGLAISLGALTISNL